MESKQLDKDLHKVTESTRWTSRTSYYGPATRSLNLRSAGLKTVMYGFF